MVTKECPLCGEMMQLRERQVTDRVPGYAQIKTTKSVEWLCQECDYYEEFDEDEDGG
jgi:C4-type Zn-finger protein